MPRLCTSVVHLPVRKDHTLAEKPQGHPVAARDDPVGVPDRHAQRISLRFCPRTQHMLLSPPMQHDVLNFAGTRLPGGTGVVAIFFRYTFYISLLLAPLLAHAETKIAGIELADSYHVGQQSLLLNGAGIRSKLFIKIYVGALYLVKTSNSPADILAAPGAKSMQMTMLYKEVEAEKITQGWDDGFKANLTDTELKALEGRLKKFNALFRPALREGDVVRMDYSSDTGTRLNINNKQLGRIEGADFFAALLKVWIGEQPADKNLKKGLLGG